MEKDKKLNKRINEVYKAVMRAKALLIAVEKLNGR